MTPPRTPGQPRTTLGVLVRMFKPKMTGRVRRRVIAIFASLLLILTGLELVDRLLLHPWSTSWAGNPSLTGYWAGEVKFAPDDTRRLVIRLKYKSHNGRCTGCGKLRGASKLCGRSGAQRAEVYGDTKNRSGSRFSVSTDETSQGADKYLNQLDGEWQDDRITIHTSYLVVDAGGVARGSTAEDTSLTVQLRRSTEDDFDRAC